MDCVTGTLFGCLIFRLYSCGFVEIIIRSVGCMLWFLCFAQRQVYLTCLSTEISHYQCMLFCFGMHNTLAVLFWYNEVRMLMCYLQLRQRPWYYLLYLPIILTDGVTIV